jgi:hypothetical protein
MDVNHTGGAQTRLALLSHLRALSASARATSLDNAQFFQPQCFSNHMTDGFYPCEVDHPAGWMAVRAGIDSLILGQIAP